MLDDVLLDIEPVALSSDGLEFLDGLADQPEAEWYYRRRREALAAAGLLGAYNPMQPRGKDGRWIEVFGWVRWLAGGKWRRGQVKSWSKNDGAMLVKADNGDNLVFGKNEIPRRIYSTPTPKGTMQLPQPGAHGAGDVDAPGFSKIGGQGGSNPGGMYQVTSPAVVKADSPITPEMMEASLAFHGHSSAMQPLIGPYTDDEIANWLAAEPLMKPDNSLIIDRSTNRTYSKIGNTYWDLGTNESIDPAVIFGDKNSGRRHEIEGKLDIVSESETLPFSEFANILSAAKSMAGPKPGKDDKFYIKTTKSPDHAKNEALANYLYELGGVPVPETSIGSDGLTFSSRIVEGEEINELSTYFLSPGKVNSEGFAVLDQLRENFAFDAWLANWDVVGLEYDNVKVVDGVPYRIDAGGALMYRAKGKPKGSAFGADVGELETLLNPSINPQSTNVFGGIDDYQIRKGVERLAAIAPQDIINAVEAHGLDSSLSDKLLARRAFILYKYDVDLTLIHPKEMSSLPPELPEPDVLPPLPPSPSDSDVPTPKTFPTDISAMYYNADAENFLPGAAPPDTATTAYVQYLQMFDDRKAQAIVDEFQHGEDVFIVHNDAVWEVDEVTPAPGYDGVHRIDLVHAATGEKMTIPAVGPTDTFPSFGGAEMSAGDFAGNLSENVKANYGALFRDYRNNTVNKYRSTQAAANATNILVPGMAMENVGVGFSNGPGQTAINRVKPGSWVVDETDPLKVRAYKIIKVDKSYEGGYSPSLTTFHTHDMDGEEVSFTGNWFLRTGKPGSVVNETFDAIQARNIVAKTNEKNDADALSTVAAQNVPTPTDTVMQNLSASQGASENVPSYGGTVAPFTPLSPTEPPELPTPTAEHEYFDPETQINKNLTVVGDVVDVYGLDINSVQPYIGKKVYFRFLTKAGDTKDRGVFTLVGAEERYQNNPEWGLVLDFVDSTGRPHKKKSRGNKYDDGTAHGEMFEIEGNIAPILKYTEKKNGDLVVNGEVVGSWEKTTPSSYWEKPKWVATINGKYTVSGKDFTTVGLDKRASVKTSVVPLLMAPGSGGTKPKTAKVKEIQKQIVLQQIAFGSNIKETTPEGNAVTLMDGAEVKLGMWTISKTDGKIGKIVATKVSPEAGVTGSVKVEYDDPSSPGKKYVKIRGASTLSAAISPDGELPPGSPLFAKVKLADNSQPFASQEVMDDAGAAVIIMGIKPDGSVRVMNLMTGAKNWTKASKLKPSKDYSKEVIVEVDAEPGGVISAADESWKMAPKAGKIPYAAPGGAVVSQPSNAVAEYRQFAQARKLTRDNFVPSIGMKVRDEKGTQLVIVRQNESFASNPSTVYVVDPTLGGKPKARQPNRLWVDHSAELSTWDGQPLPKVNGAHFTAHGGIDQTYPDGSTLYSYSEITHTYSGNRKKVIKYFLIKPDGTVSNIDATGATSEMSGWQVESVLGKGPAKVAYFDATSTSKITAENAGSAGISKIWVHDGAPGALDDLKVQVAKEAITPIVPGELQSDVEPEKFGGDTGTLVDLPKPSNAPDTGTHTAGPPPPPPQSEPARLAQPAVVAGSFSIGTALPELKKRIAAGDPGGRVMYSMGDSDYVEDMAIRIQSVFNKQTNEEMVEIRFHLLEDKVDDLSTRLITNQGQAKTGGWNKTPLKTPKDIVVGDAISVRISDTIPEPDGGALKPHSAENPNATVISSPVLVGMTKNGLEAYRIDVVTAGGASGSLIVENRATPSVPTYEWDSTKIIPSSYFDSTLNPDAASMGWSVRNDHSSGYETAHGHGEPDGLGRKIIEPDGTGVRSTGSLGGSYRLKYKADDGSYMTVQLTHPAAEKRQSIIPKGSTGISKGRRQTVNGEVLIRVPADDPNALDRISEMMSAAGVPPSAQGQPTGRDLRKMALHKVFKQFNPTYEHMQRPDVTGDDDASAQAVLSLIDAQVKQHMPNQRNVTMDDINLRVAPSGRMEVVLSDDVAHALNAKGNFKFAYHHFSRGYQPLIWTSKAETGLMSTDERWSSGILVDGGSSTSDVSGDAGNRIFFRFSSGNSIPSSADIVLSPTAVNKKLDNYWSPDDFWGRRQAKNTAVEYLSQTSFGGSNEVKIKRMIDPEMMAFVMVDYTTLTQRINELKAAGITHINGRPVEEIWRTRDMINAGDFDDLGAHYGTEIPITAIPLEGTVPPVAPAATVVVGGGTMSGNFSTTTGNTITFTTTSDPRTS